ncbi:MAG TPA: fatty acid desaturase [Pseudomonadales bacterium]|nr:fatty acid desaturase [Pseudomonadales bacterium]
MSAASPATETAGAGPDLSVEAERAVARRFMGGIQWQMIAQGLGQVSLWFTNWYLVLAGTVPLWGGFLIATFCACLAYLPSHEGQHGNLSGRRKGLRWLDSWVGHLTLITLATSHEVLRITHMKHHAFTNDPDGDVDILSSGEHWWQPALGVHRKVPEHIMARHLEDPAFVAALQKGVPVVKAYGLLQLVLVVFLPLETLLLWWLPRKIALSYLAVFFSWLPHHPARATGRYRDTRFWRIRLPRWLDQSMQTHVIHHLYPGIPHWKEPAAMEALRPFMIERGVPGATEIPDRVRFNALMADRGTVRDLDASRADR